MRTRWIRGLTLAIVVALWATPAAAQSWSNRDARGDVEQYRYPSHTKAPAVRNGDVTSVDYRWGARFDVWVHYRDLIRKGDRIDHVIRIRNGRRTFFVNVIAKPGHWAGYPLMSDRDCRGMRHQIRYGADVVHLSVPASCLDAARRIQVSGETQLSVGEALSFVDNHLTRSPQVQPPRVWSPWIRRR